MRTIIVMMLTLSMVVISNQSMAQQPLVMGYLRDSMTMYPIAGGTITNWNTKKKTLTDGNGYFKIEAKNNELLYAQAPQYAYDTLRTSILLNDTVTIFLSSTGDVLPVVTISTGYTKYQLDSLSRIRSFLQARGNTLTTVSRPNTSGFGVALNLDRIFKDKYKNKKRQEELFERTERFAYVEYRFPARLVAYYTGLKGDALRDFVFRYTPSYEWLRRHPSNEEVLWYINDKLKEFRKNARP